jgi:mannose-6-phosphate isomerase
MRPLTLPPNQLHRFYRGGERIAALRGLPSTDDHAPEDWVGATSTTFGSEDEGLARLEDGRLVRDLVAARPEAVLGPEHVARLGADLALLVKLLDAGERLPVHLHPGRAFARAALGSPYGKTEAWIIVQAEPGASVHVGFREEADPERVARWVAEQDTDAMLAALRELPVRAGDAILVPAGTPHAIGAGILLVELQEPTDLSVLLEHERLPLDGTQPELGLGWPRALEALDRSPWDDGRLAAAAAAPAPLRPGAQRLLPASADAYFRAERLTAAPGAPAELDAGVSVLVALDGAGTLATEGGERPLRRGDTVLVPHAAGAGTLDGDLEVVRCRPPDPAAQEAPW